MKKIRDFIYDYNDVFVAMIIVIAAAFIIYWRVGSVLNFSAYSASKTPDTPAIDIEFSEEDLAPIENDPIENPTEDPTENPGGETDQPGTVVPVDPAPENPGTEEPAPENPVTGPAIEVKTLRLEVSSAKKTSNWTAVGNALESAGIIPSRKEFVARVVERKLDGKLHLGTYDFDSTMSLDHVIDILTN